MNIKIKIGDQIELKADLYKTQTGEKIYQALPLQGKGGTWGEEIYFSTAVEAPLEEEAQEVVQRGDLAYWPDIQAFCIFYGPTPASRGDEIRAAGPVNVVGKITDDVSVLKKVEGTVEVTVEEEG